MMRWVFILSRPNPEEVCSEVMHRKSAESIFELEINYQDISSYFTFLPAYSMIGAPVVKTEEKMKIKSKDLVITIAGVNFLVPGRGCPSRGLFL